MTNPGQEKEYTPTDPVSSANATDSDEPIDVDGEEKDFVESSSPVDESVRHSLSGDDPVENEKKLQLQQTKSYATSNSVFTRTESNVEQPKKPWYKNYNPLRWGGIPPVPETRKVSREYNAPFLSLLYFQWMAPLMSVSPTKASSVWRAGTDVRRLDTSGNSSRTTSGRSIQTDLQIS